MINIAIIKRWIFFVPIIFMVYPLQANSFTERRKECLDWVDWHINLIKDNSDLLKKSVVSYLPYSDQKNLSRGEYDTLYHHVLEQCNYQYDIFCAYIYEDREVKFFVLKDDQVFLWIPYLKVSGSSKKWTITEWHEEIRILEKDLFSNLNLKELDRKIIAEIMEKLKKLRNASMKMDEYSNPIQPEVSASIVKVMDHFKKLQSPKKGFDYGELLLLDDYFANTYMGTSKEFFFYGMSSKIFGVSIGMFVTGLGTPSSEIAYLMMSLMDYAANPIVKKDAPETLFYMDVKQNPFIQKYWNSKYTIDFFEKKEDEKIED